VVAEGSGVGIRLENNGNIFVIPLDDPDNRLRDWVDRQIIFGIRPEQITHKISSQLEHEHTHLAQCVVEINEPTGPDTLVFVKLNGKLVVCRSHPDEAKAPGDAMELMFDLSKAVFFDPTSEKRIMRGVAQRLP
jgi:multiple sugar transport system ATP-binding protein